MHGGKSKRATVLLIVVGLGGVLLGVIGVRYLLVPESAARTFGVPGRPVGHELHSIIGLRNLWLGALAIGLAALRQWHGLALWFATGTAVCFADALIAATATGKPPQVAFHVLCGFLYAVLAGLCWERGVKGS
jgi:uncharacterized protein DUF4267